MTSVQTVTGPIGASELGTTSVHEHLLIDLGVWLDAGDPEAAQVAGLLVGPGTEAVVRANPFAVRDNLVLDSLEVAAAEVSRFRDAGGRTMVRTKTQLRAHGGRGYDHLLTGVRGLLRDAGLPEAAHAALVVDNPRRLLGGA